LFPCYHTNLPEFSNYTCKKSFPRLHLNSSFVFIFSRVKDGKTLLERPTSCFIFAPLFTNDVTVFVFTFIRGHVLWIEWLKYYNDRRYGYILMFRNCFTSLQASENWDRKVLNIMSRFILNIVWKSWRCFSGTSTKREIICAHWQVIILQDSSCFHCRDRRIRKLLFFEQEDISSPS